MSHHHRARRGQSPGCIWACPPPEVCWPPGWAAETDAPHLLCPPIAGRYAPSYAHGEAVIIIIIIISNSFYRRVSSPSHLFISQSLALVVRPSNRFLNSETEEEEEEEELLTYSYIPNLL